jgi:integrase/recombinase XerC
VSALPVIEVAPKIGEFGPLLQAVELAVKDKSYQRSPVGHEIRRYLRSLRWSGAPETTRDSYESVLARLALRFDHYQGSSEFCTPGGSEYLANFLDHHWGDKAQATRAHHHSVLRAFFTWGVGEGLLPYHPMQGMRSPRRRSQERTAPPRELVTQLLRQDSLRDVVALRLLCHLAFRKDELRRCRIRDFDLARNLVLVHGKGDKEKLLPLEGWRSLTEDLYLHIQGEGRQPNEYLLYARDRRLRPMNPASVHRWFKRCLEKAGLPVTTTIHELRHFAADELWRETGNLVLAQKLLRHASVGTTQVYLHPNRQDLAEGMRSVAASWESEG